MKLMACSLNTRNCILEVELSKTPRMLDRKTIAHIGVPNSKLVDATTVVYYDEVCDIMESDVVFCSGAKIGTLFYSAGWSVINELGVVKKLTNYKHIIMEIRKGERSKKQLQAVTSLECRRSVKFCVNTLEYCLSSILYNTEQGIVVSGIAQPVLPRSLMLATGLRLEARSDSYQALPFGALYDGGIVSMSAQHELCITDFNGKLIKTIEEEDFNNGRIYD